MGGAASQPCHQPSRTNTELAAEVIRLTALLASCEVDAQRVVSEAVSNSRREMAAAQATALQLAGMEDRMKTDRASYESHMNEVVIRLRSELDQFRDAASAAHDHCMQSSSDHFRFEMSSLQTQHDASVSALQAALL